MSDKRLHTKAELKKLFTNLRRKGITDDMITILVDVLWRSKPSLRTSGFYWPGAPDMIMEWSNSTRTLTLSPRPPDDPEAEGADEYEPHFRFYSWAGEPVFHRHYAYDPELGYPNPDEIQLPDEEGLYAVYFDVDQETNKQALTYVKNPEYDDIAIIYLKKVIVVWIYWDAVAREAIYYGDSRHGSEWIPAMHWFFHQTFNSRREQGISLVDVAIDGDGSENSHYQFGISGGTLFHEDLYQQLEAVGVSEALPVWYINDSGNPRYLTQTSRKFINTGLGLLAWNNSGIVTEATDKYFVLYHYFATNDILQPVIAVMGQNEYAGIGDAVSAVDAEIKALRAELPHSNMMHISSLVFQTSYDYVNSAKSRIVYATGSGEGITSIFAEPDPLFPIEYLKYILGGKEYYVTDIPKANGLVWGGRVTWFENLDFAVSPAAYYINGKLYTTEISEVTLDPADETYSRIDLIVVDINGNVSVITGTPAETPQKPQIDPASQIELTSVLIPALATEPGDVTSEMIYDELEPGEWDIMEFQVQYGNLDWTANFYHGTMSRAGFGVTDQSYMGFMSPEIKYILYKTSISGWLHLATRLNEYQTIQFALLKDGSQISNWVIIPLDKNIHYRWQNFVIVLSQLELTSDEFDEIRFKFVDNSPSPESHSGFLLDYIQLQKGLEQPPVFLEDKYTTAIDFDNETRKLTLTRSNNLPDLTVVIPGSLPIQVTGLTLLSTGWSLVGSFYEYDLSDTNITEDSIVDVIPDNADIDTVEDAVIMPHTDSSAGSVKIYAENEPTGDIGVTINIFEKQT